MRARLLLALSLLIALALLAACGSPAATPPDPLLTEPAVDPTAGTAGPTVRTTPGAGSITPTASPTDHSDPPTLDPSPTPATVLRSLTAGGCCTEPFWAPDGESLLYIDRPSPDAPAGLWRIELQGGEPQFVTERLGIFSADLRRRAFPSAGQTLVEDLQTGEQWRIPNDGRAVSFSPDGAWLAWTAGQSGPPFDSARREVWISRSDGSEAQMVYAARRAGFEGWFPDGRLLVSAAADGGGEIVYALSLATSSPEQPDLLELGRGGRLREAKISPGGGWLAYLATFSADPALDGIWLADTRSGERRKLTQFGGYNWRDEARLLLVPLLLDQPRHWLVQIEAASGEATVLTDPLQTPFRIANGDWRVSPDGGEVVFVSAADGNIWLLELGE